MKLKKHIADVLVILLAATSIILAFDQQKKLNDELREHKQTRETLKEYKAKLKECDYAYTANVKTLDSVSKELYEWHDAAYRSQESVRAMYRYKKENR